jgi:GT2 family glycosyltransferase
MGRDASAAVVIATRARPEYLQVTLASIVPQAAAAGASVLVVCDGPDPSSAAVAAGFPEVDIVALAARGGANAARNAGIELVAGSSELIVFVDDDVLAPDGWLAALLDGAGADPSADAFGGPIRPLLEGGGPRACGREPAPITALDLGDADRDVEFVWSANMAVRTAAFDRIGSFDETILGRGEEEEWQRRLAADGGRVRYVARAALHHRRVAADCTVRRMSAAAFDLGRSARRYDMLKGSAPPLGAELRTLAGCGWHTARRRCAYGVVLGAHSAGRVRETLLGRAGR